MLTLQFYIFPSGQPQPAHVLALLFILTVFLKTPTFKTLNEKPITLFAIYTLYTIVINAICTFLYSDQTFLPNILYSAFNFLLFLSAATFFTEKERALTKYVKKPILISLALTVFFYVIGIGRYDFFPRYNAFFNDPNQMAHWALCCFSILCLLGVKNRWLIIGGFSLLVICITSSSRSALLGLFPLLLGYLIYTRENIKAKSKSNIGLFLFILFITILITSLYILIEYRLWEKSESLSFILERTESTDTSQQLDERGYNLFFQYPEYLLFGSGHGGFGRFNRAEEIHSNWMGLLFYYGLIGFILFVSHLFIMLKKLPLHLKLIAIGPLLYGFSTFGLRTPVFYFYLASLYYCYKKNQTLKKGNFILQETI
ncbi:hypothetical protein HR17_05485 [Porphyromonas gulae]|nr:hypothetical protein HR17_05485 [Porphyromonas gulae]